MSATCACVGNLEVVEGLTSWPSPPAAPSPPPPPKPRPSPWKSGVLYRLSDRMVPEGTITRLLLSPLFTASCATAKTALLRFVCKEWYGTYVSEPARLRSRSGDRISFGLHFLFGAMLKTGYLERFELFGILLLCGQTDDVHSHVVLLQLLR